ncbi:MAG TPA: DUF1697 domain-containing protein [Pyrinomonadaceae bacterium]|nr:DUF1697 domain-containing protein [Pyrinomonadaceae bacterium]
MTKSKLNVFVALLRGVNVGGNNMISMSSLKKSFEAMGFPHVSTYINSGNIIFTTKENDARKLEKKIEQMLSKDYQLDSRVVLRSLPEMEKLVQSLPKTWAGDPNWRYNVIFLRHTIDSEKILDELVVKPDIEEVLYRPGALLWSAQVSDLTRTQMVKLSSRKMYQDMTIRNLNTTRKLSELMKKVAETSGRFEFQNAEGVR